MNLEMPALLRSFTVAIFLHAVGFFLLKIKAPPIPDPGWTEVLFWDKTPPARGAPLETSSDPEQAISSFLALPETGLSLDEKSSFPTNRIKRFRPDPEEDYFGETDKALAEEMDYLESELDPGLYLPLEEREIAPLPLLLPERKASPIASPPGLRWHYQGANKIEIEKKYFALFDLLKKWNSKPPSPLILRISFDANRQIVQCQREQSSGDSTLDDAALRLLQKNISPQTKPGVAFRGQFTLRWEDSHD